MKRSIFTLLAFTAFLSSCVISDEKVTPESPGDHTAMGGLIIPDGFDFEMYRPSPVKVSFAMDGSAGRVHQSQQLQYAILGVDQNGETHGISSGSTSLAQGLDLDLSLPLHLDQLLLYTKYEGNARFFELSDQPLEITYDDLFVDDLLHAQQGERTSSTPTCTSFLGNATKIHCRKNEIVLQSSASFESVSINTTAGDTLSYYPEDGIGSLNSNGNLWTFTDDVDGTPFAQIASFTVYAYCKTAPKSVGLELVTFTNPCSYEEQDGDGDGVEDANDLDPNDPDVSAATYIPAKERYATFAFEDMWPYKGDYDFNDLVVSHNATVYTNASGGVTKVAYDYSIRAIGAKYDNDFCISFSDPSNSMQISSIDPHGLNYVQVDLNGLTELRFIQFKDLFGHEGFINTDTSKHFFEPVRVTFEVVFDGSVAVSEFKIDEYLRINQEEGREVHKPGVAFTSLMDQTMIGMAADDTDPSSSKYFKTTDNLPWVLEIPTEWEYPKEKIELVNAYPNFKDFAQGKKNSPWYTDENGNKVHKHLYKR